MSRCWSHAPRANAPRVALLSAVVAMGLWLSACASPTETSFDTDSEVDMTVYATFAWIQPEPLIEPGAGEKRSSTFLSPIDDQRIRRAVAETMKQKGYLPADDPETADLIVSYTIGSEEKIKVNNNASYGYGAYGRGYGFYGYGPTVQQYAEGTLAIEFWDRETRQAVWIGWASKRLWRKRDYEQYDVQEAVVALLEPFPTR